MANERQVTLQQPEAGETLVVSVQPEIVFCLAFETYDCLFEVYEKNLILHFENNAKIVLQDFLQYTESNIPIYLSVDGSLIDGKQLIELFLQDWDNFAPGCSALQDLSAMCLISEREEKFDSLFPPIASYPEGKIELFYSDAAQNIAFISDAGGPNIVHTCTADLFVDTNDWGINIFLGDNIYFIL